MADLKISELEELTTPDPLEDYLAIVDSSESKTKRIKPSSLGIGGNAQTLEGSTVSDILQLVYPVGSIYINATNSTNPETLLGFGTWAAFGAGRVPVGFNSGDSDFNSAEKTGGAKTHALTQAEMPAHTHTLSFPTSQYVGDVGSGGNQTSSGPGSVWQSNRNFPSATGSRGSGDAHNNLQPYITVHMWKRTA